MPRFVFFLLRIGLHHLVEEVDDDIGTSGDDGFQAKLVNSVACRLLHPLRGGKDRPGAELEEEPYHRPKKVPPVPVSGG